MKSIGTLFILILLQSSLFAQKMGKIDTEVLKQTVHPLDSSAHAAFISRKADVIFNLQASQGINMEISHHHIIKIYDEQGEDYGDYTINFYQDGSKRERISNIKAVTVNLVNGKEVVTQLNKKDIWEEEVSENWKAKKFAMPEVRAGSVIEIRYTVITPYIYTIPKWYFQSYIPCDYAEYVLNIPEYFSYTPVSSGAIALESGQTSRPRRGYNDEEYIFKANNIPAFKEDEYVLHDNDYRAGIKYELQTVHIPGRTIEHYSKSWNEIGSNLLDADYFGGQINKNLKELNPIVEQALKLSADKRIQFLYDYVRSEYVWNENYSRGAFDGLKKVVEEKTGSIGDLNLLLINLLNKAEIQAHPMVTKSRNSGLLNTNYPSLTELNYVMAYIQMGEQFLLLDASSKWSPIGELPFRAININGIVIYPKSTEIINLSNPNLYKIQTISKYEIDLEHNSLVGESQRKRSKYAATKYRIDLENKDKVDEESEEEEEDDDDLDRDFEEFNLDNTYEVIEQENIENIGEPIKLIYNEELFTTIKVVGEKIFLDAALDFGLKENPFKEAQRNYPVFYSYLIDSRSIAAINIPKGYVIESQPETVKLGLPDNKGSFSYDIKIHNNQLMIYYIFKMNTDILSYADYPALKQLYDMIYSKSKEKIVLTKA